MSSDPKPISPQDARKKLEDPTSGPVVFIFGAGASAGYTATESPHLKAPLVRELFQTGNPTVARVLASGAHSSIGRRLEYINRRIQQAFDGDLETYLSDLYTNNKDTDTTFSDVLRYLEEIFFLASQNISFDKNHYISLFNHIAEIRRGRIFSYITFNYDTILEKSYLVADRDPVRRAAGFQTMTNYYDAQPAVLKMHGSINYRYVVEKESEPSDSFNPNFSYAGIFNIMMGNAPTENIGSAREECIDLNLAKAPQFKQVIGHAGGPGVPPRNVARFDIPLMLIPVHEEISPENNFFLSMIERAKKEIDAASVVVAIGYNFGDKAFMNKLANLDFSKKNIILVTSQFLAGKMHNHHALKNIFGTWKDASVEFFEGAGFGDFVEALLS